MYWPLLPIAMEDCANFTPTLEENDQYSANYSCNTSIKLIHFSVNSYTTLVIGRNDKNKKLTLLSQRELALTAINKLFAL
jgi:hypothetical protein